MSLVPLVPHPTSSGGGLMLEVETRRAGDILGLEYRLAGPVETVLWSPPAPRERTDGLWRTTCFEAFVETADGYVEFNLSPSGAWAAYGFDGYRQGMRPTETAPPFVAVRHAPGVFALTVDLKLSAKTTGRVGLSAVIQGLDGAVSYWALAHPSDMPDFHHPDSFALKLAP